MESRLALAVIAVCAGVFVLLVAFHRVSESEVPTQDEAEHEVVGTVPPLPDGVRADSLIVEKARRLMHLYSGGELAKSYRIGLGPDPAGHKQSQGDGRTPEGRYAINGRNPGSAYHLSLRVSYPNAADVESARRRGVSPGGDIFIHGTPGTSGRGSESRPPSDWTLGCIAVTNDEIEELWRTVPDGTPIVIRP